MAKEVTASWIAGRAWRATARGLEVIGDSAKEHGGEDRGMSPVELMVSAVALCTGIDLSWYAERHPHIDLAQIQLTLAWEDAPARPSRVAAITMTVTLPAGLPDADRAAMTRIANGCKVHNSLEQGVAFAVEVR